jgi:hypothetical protein
MSGFKFKCIAVVLLCCLTLPVFAEDIVSFKAANSFVSVFAGNSESPKEATEKNNFLFSVDSRGFYGADLDNNPSRMLTEATEAEKPAAKKSNTVWWIIGGVVVALCLIGVLGVILEGGM